MPREKRETVSLQARLPVDLHADLVRLAEFNERSLNAELIVRLRAAISLDPGIKRAAPKRGRQP